MIQVVASLTINPEAPEAVQTYFDVALPLIQNAGAKVVQKIDVGETIVGDPPVKILMLVDYPSREAVLRVFESVEYRSIVEARKQAFLEYNVSFVSSNSLDSDTDDGWS